MGKTELEIEVETRVVDRARAHGWRSRKLKWEGRKSAFDRVFFGHGRCVFIEFKREGETLTELQQREYDRMVKLYDEIYWTDSFVEACEILGIT